MPEFLQRDVIKQTGMQDVVECYIITKRSNLFVNRIMKNKYHNGVVAKKIQKNWKHFLFIYLLHFS